MQKKISILLVEILIMVAMLFGWLAMLIKKPLSESYELLFFNPLRHGFLIFLIATPAFVLVSKRRAFSERLSMGMIIFGILFLCQPFTIVLYQCGFQTLLVGTLAFIIVSHMRVART